jgi:hypothetical protein
VIADRSAIVTSRIFLHLTDLLSPSLTFAQRRTSEIGRYVVPRARHWSALIFPWLADLSSLGTDVNQDGVTIVLMSDQISSISLAVNTCPCAVDVSAPHSHSSC